MTAQSSSKDRFVPFLTYLKYRLGLLKINFVMCCILNVLGLPLYSIAANVGFGGGISEFAMTARAFSSICIASLPFVAMFNAISAFDYYHKKDLTDTIGALPLSFRERFFADLLTGYAINVLPLIPCGLFCVIAMGNTQEKLRRFHHSVGDSFKMADVGLIIAAAVFVIITFAYLFTALMSVCCGKVYHTVIFSLFGMAVLPLMSYGLVRCFVHGVVGIDGSEYISRGVEFFPPIGLISELFEAMGLAFDANPDITFYTRADDLFTVLKPVNTAVYVVLAAGLVWLTYALAKRRLAENTGSAFAVKPAFNVTSAGITAGVTISVLAMCYNETPYFGLVIGVAAAAGALAFLVTLLINPRRKKATLKSLIFGAAAIASMLVVWLVIFKTGSFGARYLPKDPDKVGTVWIDDSYRISDEEEIKTYITLLNDTLRANPKEMEYDDNPWSSDSFSVEIQTPDGYNTIERRYGSAETGRYIFSHLDGYVDHFFDGLGTISNWTCSVRSDNVNIYIPVEKTEEFVAVLREDAAEKHDPDAPEFAEAKFSGRGDRRFIIEQSYTRTIAFLESLNEGMDVDPEEHYLSISYNSRGVHWDSFTIRVPYKDRDDARVKELIELLKNSEGTRDSDFHVFSNHVAGLGDVTDRNRDRVLELMASLAAGAIGG